MSLALFYVRTFFVHTFASFARGKASENLRTLPGTLPAQKSAAVTRLVVNRIFFPEVRPPAKSLYVRMVMVRLGRNQWDETELSKSRSRPRRHDRLIRHEYYFLRTF